MSRDIWALGAESIILRVRQCGQPLIIKTRLAKPYLLEEIDVALRRSRTIRECRMLTFVRTLGVPTPAVYSIDLFNYSITMDFIEGRQLKSIVSEESLEYSEGLFERFGRMIGLMHNGGVVHGDPTTSNVIVDNQDDTWLVDFGLAEWNADLEMKGVDLHLIRRALETTHWAYQERLLDRVLQGYSAVVGEEAKETISRMEEISERGRYH
jgi:TP53 regulating kinase-like protein